MDFVSFLPMGCVVHSSHYDLLLAYTIVPLVLNAALVAAYFGLKASNKRVALSNAVMSMLFLMNYLILPQVSMVVFKTFSCRQFDGDYGSYLIADYSLSCDSPEHKWMVAYASVMVVVYPLGIPLANHFMLWRVRDKVNPNQRNLVFESGSEKAGLAKATQIRDKNKDIQYLSFLFAAYQPEYWWFESFESARRIIFTGALKFVDAGSVTQCALGLLFAFVCVRVYARYKPFALNSSSRFGEIMQWQLALTFLATLLLKVSEESDEKLVNEKAFDAFLVALQFVAPSYLIVNFLLEMRGVREERKIEKQLEALVRADSLDAGGAEEAALGEKGGTGAGGSGQGKGNNAKVVPI